jgi:ABC-2 type transport system ATP-binding protein
MSTVVIRTENLRRRYGVKAALDGLDLVLESGRIVALLGPNGAGKTTLLRLLAGVLEPTDGGAAVLGDDSRRLGPGAAGRLGFLIDGHEPPGWARLRWMASLQASASPAFDAAMAAELLAEVHLDAAARYGRLSKGQRRWALAAMVLASQPDLFVLDEPADGLDPASRRSLYSHLRRQVNDRGSTALVATHIIDDVERVADEVAVLHGGRLLLHADLETLREEVREVEVSTAAPAAALGVTAKKDQPETTGVPLQVMATVDAGAVRRTWVRGDGDVEARIADQFGDAAGVHPFNLEQLFLALTHDPAPAGGRAGRVGKEVGSCD